MIRVLATADTIGGVWTYATDLAEALRPLGVVTVLATMGRPLDRDQRARVREIPDLEVVESTYRLEWMDDAWDDVHRAGQWLLDLEQRHAPDLVHLNGFAHGAWPFAAPVLVVAHSCVCSWWEAVKGEPAPARYDRYRLRVTAGLRGADVVAAPTSAMLDAIVRHYGPLGTTAVVPNGTRLDRWAPAPEEPVVLAAGRLWDEAKNLAALDAAAAELPWPVHVAGDSAHSPQDGLFDRKRVRARHATLLGRLDRAGMRAALSRAAIFAHPARYEPFGLAPLEAAASGCALLLGDIPSLREVWGEDARYVDPADPVALASALRELIASPAERRDLARRALVRARRYTAEGLARTTRSLYGHLLAGAPRRLEVPA